ncbi:MAG: glucosyltransferase domain-containing protein [Eubacteriales bacterium]
MKMTKIKRFLLVPKQDLARNQENETLVKKVFFWVILFGLMAHGFAFSNQFYSHDSIIELNALTEYNSSSAVKISVGRFLQPVVYHFRGALAAPWLIGCLSLIWVALATTLLAKIFRFSNLFLVAGLLTTSVSYASTNATYIHESDMFMLALLFAVLTAYFISLGSYGYCIAPVALMLSCGLYQAFLSVAVVLVEILILRSIMEGKSDKDIIKQSIFSVISLLSGVILYYTVYKLVLVVTGIPALDSYNAIPDLKTLITGFFTPEITQLFASIYLNFIRFLITPITGYPTLVPVINIVLVMIFLVNMGIILTQSTKSAVKTVVFCSILLLLPFTMNLSHFLSGGTHTLMEYAFLLPYLLLLLMIEHLRKSQNIPKLCSQMVSLCLAFIVMGNMIYSNQLYLKKEMSYDNTLLTMNRVITKIEEQEEYVLGETPVMFVGLLESSGLAPTSYLFQNLTGLGAYHHQFSLTYYYTYPSYFLNVLCYPINIVYEQEIRDSEVVGEMPIFPQSGSVQMVDSVIVVRLGA